MCSGNCNIILLRESHSNDRIVTFPHMSSHDDILSRLGLKPDAGAKIQYSLIVRSWRLEGSEFILDQEENDMVTAYYENLFSTIEKTLEWVRNNGQHCSHSVLSMFRYEKLSRSERKELDEAYAKYIHMSNIRSRTTSDIGRSIKCAKLNWLENIESAISKDIASSTKIRHIDTKINKAIGVKNRLMNSASTRYENSKKSGDSSVQYQRYLASIRNISTKYGAIIDELKVERDTSVGFIKKCYENTYHNMEDFGTVTWNAIVDGAVAENMPLWNEFCDIVARLMVDPNNRISCWVNMPWDGSKTTVGSSE